MSASIELLRKVKDMRSKRDDLIEDALDCYADIIRTKFTNGEFAFKLAIPSMSDNAVLSVSDNQDTELFSIVGELFQMGVEVEEFEDRLLLAANNWKTKSGVKSGQEINTGALNLHSEYHDLLEDIATEACHNLEALHPTYMARSKVGPFEPSVFNDRLRRLHVYDESLYSFETLRKKAWRLFHCNKFSPDMDTFFDWMYNQVEDESYWILVDGELYMQSSSDDGQVSIPLKTFLDHAVKEFSSHDPTKKRKRE